MAVLAKAGSADVLTCLDSLDDIPSYTVIRPPEVGSVMVRGRTGGTGSPFSLGEMTVTRCVVLLDEHQTTGHAYLSGRDKRHAEAAALLDALLQTDAWRDRVMDRVIKPLSATMEENRSNRARKVAATRVEFFTMVRGED